MQEQILLRWGCETGNVLAVADSYWRRKGNSQLYAVCPISIGDVYGVFAKYVRVGQRALKISWRSSRTGCEAVEIALVRSLGIAWKRNRLSPARRAGWVLPDCCRGFPLRRAAGGGKRGGAAPVLAAPGLRPRRPIAGTLLRTRAAVRCTDLPAPGADRRMSRGAARHVRDRGASGGSSRDVATPRAP